MTIALHGIPNCDTVRKARAWLDQRRVAYVFHDYKKEGVDPARLAAWSEQVGWEALLNRRGTTFRALPDGEKAGIDKPKALRLMETHPSLIKRPVVEYRCRILVGFDPDAWERAFAG